MRRPKKSQPTLLFCQACRFHPVACPKFLHGRREVVANRPFGKKELCCNGFEAGPGKSGGEHLALPRGKRILPFREAAQGQFGINHPVPIHHPPQASPPFCRWRILYPKAHPPPPHPPPHIPPAPTA